jgi:hypothetical protein
MRRMQIIKKWMANQHKIGKKIFFFQHYENDTFITQFSEENRRLHH